MSNEGKILCLDYGARYVGVAVTDADGKIALRHSVIDRKQQDAVAAVRELVVQQRAYLVLVGVPVSLDGTESAQTKISRDFIIELQNTFGETVKVKSVDERFTSKEAERRIKAEGGKSTDAHAEAARLMLESYLVK